MTESVMKFRKWGLSPFLIKAKKNSRMTLSSLLLRVFMVAALFVATPAWAVSVSASKSTVVAAPTTVLADGASTSAITVTLQSKSGAAIKNTVVTLTAGSGSSITTIVNATTNNSGQAFFTVTDTVVQSVTYTAKVGGVTLNQKPTVKFVLKAPTVVKSFNPTTIAANGTSTLTITLTNLNAASITGATFTDTFPVNLVTTGAASTTCAGGTATAGGGTLTLTGGTIPASGCTVTVAVTSATAGSYANTIPVGAVTSTNALANTVTSNTATLVVTAISALNSTVTASPTTVLANGVATSTITVTLRDGAGGAVSGKTVTLAQSGISSTISAASGLSDINGVVTFTVKDAVVGTVGTTTYTTTSGGITVTQTATVTFVLVPVLKSFATSPIAANGTSALSVTLTNATGVSVSGAGFSDTYPAGLVNASNASASGCGAGVITGLTGGNTLGITNATIAANSACTVSVSVTAAIAGTYSNTATNTGGSTSTASLVVYAISAANSTVSANPASPASVLADGSSTSTITVTLKDGAATPNPVSGKTVTLSALSGGSIITTVSGVTNASGVATFTVTDITPEGAITYSAIDTTDSIAVNQKASVTFTRITAPTVAKSFNPTTIADNGTTTLTITLTNSNAGAINGVVFKDDYTLDTGGTTTNKSPLVFSNTCGGSNPTTAANGTTLDLLGGTIPAQVLGVPGTCSVSVQVTANNATCPPCTIVNSTGAVTSANANSGTAASATLTDIGVDPILSTVVAIPTAVPADNIATSIITVTLRDGAGNLVPDTIVSLAASGGSSTITPFPSIVTTDVNGQAIFTVRDGVVESVTYTATDTTDAILIAQTAAVTFTAVVPVVASFNAVEPGANAVSGKIYTKMAGQNFALDIVALNALSVISTSFTGTVAVEVVDNSSGSGVCANMTAIAAFTDQIFVAGDNGRHALSLPNTAANVWPNAKVRIKYPTSSPIVIACSGDNFAIRPSAVTLNVSPLMATPPSASAIQTIKAGASFTLTATTSPAGYAGTLALDTGKLTAQTPAQESTVQSGGTIGTLTPASLTGNAAASSNAGYNEVGYLYLAPGAFRDDSYTSVDQPSGCATTNSCDCVTDTASNANLADTIISGQYGCSIGNKTGYSFGRFVPDHFGLSAASIVNRADLACPTCTFTYMGEQMKALFTLTAQATGGGTTQNYAGVFAKLDPTSAGKLVLGAVDNAATRTPLTARLDTSVSATGGFVAGVANVGAPLGILRCTALTCPTNTNPNREDGSYAALDIGIAPVDSDGVAMAAYDLDITNVLSTTNDHTKVARTEVRYGRIKLANSYGSELLSLPITAVVQFWNGSYVTSTSDSASQFNTKLSAVGGNVQAVIVKGPLALANISVITPGLVTFTNGVKTFKLGAPSVAGSADLTIITAPGYLLPSSSGRATFGVYKGSNNIIYLRENY